MSVFPYNNSEILNELNLYMLYIPDSCYYSGWFICYPTKYRGCWLWGC